MAADHHECDDCVFPAKLRITKSLKEIIVTFSLAKTFNPAWLVNPAISCAPAANLELQDGLHFKTPRDLRSGLDRYLPLAIYTSSHCMRQAKFGRQVVRNGKMECCLCVFFADPET